MTLHDISAAITAVRVYEDRALVQRSSSLNLAKGRHSLRVQDVSPIIVDRSLRALGPGIRVLDISCQRRARGTSDQSADRQELTDQRSDLRHEKARIEAQLAHCRDEHERLVTAMQHTCYDLAQDVALACTVERLQRTQECMGAIDEALSANQQETLRLQEDLDDAQARMDGVLLRLQELNQQPTTWTADLILDIELADELDDTKTLLIEYLVPNACWRPAHHLEVLTASSQARWTAEACVWQRTGENWPQATVTCSTERPSLGIAVPVLKDDILRLRNKDQQVAVSVREQAIRMTGQAQDDILNTVPGVDDGGEVRLLACTGQHSIAGDGRCHRLPVDSFTCAARTDCLVLAEKVTTPLRRCSLSNAWTQPLLAGPVDLVVDGSAVGRTEIAYIATRQGFEIGLGPQPAVRVSRTYTKHDEDPTLFSSKQVQTHRIELFLSNISGSPQAMTVKERIPVSEIEQVKIKQVVEDSSDGWEIDADGIAQHQVTIPANAVMTLVLVYRVEAKAAVVGI